uniref:SERPIN domain-containing protein n=1 Tax=Caenorhabditis japonica TaxID=281687 RepID=A0A8R1EA76_CAEJA
MKIPKFKIEEEIDLKQTLTSLGMTEMFSTPASFSEIADTFSISKAVHKASIEIHENGTPTTLTRPSLASDTVDFIANRPFLFAVIYDGHPLILGVFHG